MKLPNEDQLVCGTCHPEELTDADRQEVNDFRRFLAMASMAPRIHGRIYFDPFWFRYTTGETPAPPLLGEFYD